MNFEFVLWDLDGPLWDPGVRGLPEEANIKKLLYAQLYGDLPLPWEGMLFEKGQPEARVRAFLSLVERVHSGKDPVEAYKPYGGIKELLAEVPTERQGIITNGWPQVQRNKLKLFGIDHYFNPDLILTAIGEAQLYLDAHPQDPDCVQAIKKAKQIHNMEPAAYFLAVSKTGKQYTFLFEKALDLVGVSPDRCLMIGDDDFDISSAQQVGMRTLYVRGIASSILGREQTLINGVPNYIKPDFVVDKGNIVELRKIILGK